MTRILTLAAALTLGALPALAQTAAPTTAPAEGAPAAAAQTPAMLPLSQILSKVEGEGDFVRFEDVEWNDRSASWSIEYRGTGGRTVTVEIAGATGEPIMN